MIKEVDSIKLNFTYNSYFGLLVYLYLTIHNKRNQLNLSMSLDSLYKFINFWLFIWFSSSSNSDEASETMSISSDVLLATYGWSKIGFKMSSSRFRT
jgi:hypothetical protein